GTFNGPIVGTVSELKLGTTDTVGGAKHVHLNGSNSYHAITTVHGYVAANSPQALGTPDLGTRVTGGILDVNAAVEESIVIQGGGRVNLNTQQLRLPRMVDVTNPTNIIYSSAATLAFNHEGAYDEVLQTSHGIVEF